MKEAIEKIVSEMKKDPEYFNSWKANIAMAVYDEVLKEFFPMCSESKAEVLQACSRGAEQFLFNLGARKDG